MPFITVRSSIAHIVASVHILSVAAARAPPKPAAHAAVSFLTLMRDRLIPAHVPMFQAQLTSISDHAGTLQ